MILEYVITLFFNVSVAPALFPIITCSFYFYQQYIWAHFLHVHTMTHLFCLCFFRISWRPGWFRTSAPSPSPLVYCIIRVHRHLSLWQSPTSRCGVCHTVGFIRLSPYVLEVLYALSHIVGPFVCTSCLRSVYSNLCPLSSQSARFLAIEFLTGFEFNPQSHTRFANTFQQLRRETCKIVSSSK